MIDRRLAFLSGDISKNPDTPRSLRAPERLFDSPLDQSVDIWSFGCLVYELLTGYALFLVMPGEHDDGHILRIIDQLGPLPERLFSKWGRSHKYYRPNGEHFNSSIDGRRIELFNNDSYATSFHKRKAPEIDDNEEASVIDMLTQILRYEQGKRPSAKELLSHTWFADNDA